MEVRRGQRTIYRGLQKLFYATLDNPELTATLVPLGDGILMLRKNVADVQLSESE
ncbi:O-methyltransferase [Streptococcus pneumoniae]|nr:O-methyltransferase [Streptococcus pneumoniae]